MRHAALLFGLLALASISASGEIVDRIAAIVSGQAITTSEVSQYEALRLIPPLTGESNSAHRARILDFLINQELQHEDMERFGTEEVSDAEVEARVDLLRRRFASEEEFDGALALAEMTPASLREVLRHQIEVERYINERFSPVIFVPLEEIETYYREVWSPEKQSAGLTPRPLSAVRDEIRALLKRGRLQEEVERWTRELRNRSNVDVYGAR